MKNLDIPIFRLLGLIVGFSLLTGSSIAQSTQDSHKTVTFTENVNNTQVRQNPNPLITLELDQVSLREALKHIADQAEAGLYYNTAFVPEKTVSQHLKEVPLYKALQKVLAGTSLRVVTSGRNISLRQKREIDLIKLPLASSQETISGTVTDAQTDETLPGVNILLKGTSTGASTDADGNFELTVESLQDTLVVSFVGYQTLEVPINGRTEIDISLQPQTITGEEMVVIGYGEVEKEDLTGSVSSVNAETFQNQSETEITNMLAGTVAGINVNQSTTAGGSASIEIRGPTSLTANTTPMVVLDGAVYNGSIRDINPLDIENIDILKGASAAAIYGSKAASGVILVTTKKGTKGKPVINFTTKIGATQSTTNKYGVRGPAEYIKFRKAFFRSNQSKPDYYWDAPDNLREGVTLEQWRAENPNPLPDNTQEYLSRLNFFPTEKETYLAGETINWYDQVMQTGLRQDYDLSIRGGTENTNYYWSGGFVDNEGIIRGDKFSTFRTRLNLSYEVADWLEIGTNTQFSIRDESEVAANLNGMQTTSPYARMRNEDGTLKWYPGDYIGGQNPLINTLGQDRDRKINDLFSSLYAELALPYGVTYKASFEPHIVSTRDYNYWSPQTIRGGRDFPSGFSRRTDYSQYRWMVQNLLKWNRSFGVHQFDVTLMQNAEKNRSWNSFMQNNTFNPSPVLGYSGMQFGINPSINTNDTQYTANALLGRLNYTLLDKYLLTASIRRDGYSAFGQAHPYATFPAVAGAWKIANEQFFNIDWINQLKLRLSWGKNGNRDIGQYAALAQLGSNQYYDGSSVEIGVTTSKLANPDLQWEETESVNVGLDVGMYENRINFSVNYYNMTTHKLLVNRSLPRLTGFSNITTNIGELDNKGFELTVNSINVSSQDFSWSSHLVFSLNRNKITKLFGESGEYTLLGETRTGEIPDFGNEWFLGRAIDVVWDYDISGIWQESEGEKAAQYNQIPGDIKARDVDNNGAYQELQDKRFIGHTEPRYRIGLRNSIDFLQNFSASVFIRADLGQIRPFPIVITDNPSTMDRTNSQPFPYWTKENQSNDWPRLGHNYSLFGGGIMVYKPASFVRIQDVSLSYSLPADIGQRLNLNNVRIFGSARNVASFTNWPGWDPESGFNDPMPQTYSVGINISL